MQRIDIADGGWLLFTPSLYTSDESAQLFAWLQTNIAWHQETIRGHPAPRLNAWVADVGVDYRYSGTVNQGAGWSDEMRAILEHVQTVSGERFNSVLLNRYRTGDDSMGYHTDAEPELGQNPSVATLSLGATRRFLIKHQQRGETLPFDLTDGSLLVMGGTSQHFWKHALPKTTKPTAERISLTFRRVIVNEGGE